jgi:hypothetical protein
MTGIVAEQYSVWGLRSEGFQRMSSKIPWWGLVTDLIDERAEIFLCNKSCVATAQNSVTNARFL